MNTHDKSQMRSRGDAGEDAVVDYLIAHGCTIIARNFSARNGELDIVAENAARILFVEVKSRVISGSNLARYGRPAAAVTRDKQRHIIAAAEAYLRKYPVDKPARFDVAEVYITHDMPPAVLHLHYIKGAFIKR